MLLVAAGCGDDDPPPSQTDASTPDAIAPQPDATPLPTFEVGYAEAMYEYRPDGLAVAASDRPVPLRVWYPVDDAADAPLATYLVGGGLLSIQTAVAKADAPPAQGRFPVVVYSHGNKGESLVGYPYGELFAAAGWIFVAPNHTGNTALDALSGTDVSFAEAALFRRADIGAVLDWLESSDAASVGDPDTSRAFVVGHSFGGYTTFASASADLSADALNAECVASGDTESCDFLAMPEVDAAVRAAVDDDRIKAIAPQAPAFLYAFVADEIAGLPMPAMLMTGRLDTQTTHEERAVPAWNQLDRPGDVWIEMPEGGHFSFISTCYDLTVQQRAVFQPDDENDGCGPQFIPARQAVAGIGDYLLAFGRLHVLGDTNAGRLFDEQVDGFAVTRPL